MVTSSEFGGYRFNVLRQVIRSLIFETSQVVDSFLSKFN